MRYNSHRNIIISKLMVVLGTEMLKAVAAKNYYIVIEQEDGGEPQIINI